MTITINGTTGITNDGGYTGDGVVFADTTPANTLVTTTGGNVGVGTSLPTSASGYTFITLQDSGANNGAVYESKSGAVSSRYYSSGANSFGAIGTFSNYPFVFVTNSGERARIDTSGNLLVGTTSGSGKATIDAGANINGLFVSNDTYDYQTLSLWNKAGANNNLFARFFTESSITLRGSITYNRGAGLTAYNTTSDHRAKDISGPVVNALSTVAQLKPWLGTMKGATVERPMFVAHEAQAVAPYAVIGEKDAVNDNGEPVYQQMDHSTLVPLLTAAIQEQQAIIDAQQAALTALTARVAALEGTQP